MNRKLLVVLVFAVYAVIQAATFRLESDHFANMSGRWKEGKSTGNTGGVYLFAETKNATVSDRYVVSEPGVYTVWALTMSLGQGWRTCDVRVNGKLLGSFGDSKEKGPKDASEGGKWYFEKLPTTIELKAGETIDVSVTNPGSMARFDFLVFSNEPGYEPGKKRIDWESIPSLQAGVRVIERSPFAGEPLVPLVSDKKLEGIFKRPVPGDLDCGPNMLLLVGGRPWQGNAFAENLLKYGARAIVLSSVYLAGHGDSIKQFPQDEVEPKALDGITPEFERLDKYNFLGIWSLTTRKQAAILTPDRVEKIKKFVSEGGKLYLTINAPECLGDLLPVVYTKERIVKDPGMLLFARRPADESFSVLPEKWLHSSVFTPVKAVDGASVISFIEDTNGKVIMPFIVSKPYGKGRVLYVNMEFGRNASGVTQFNNWVYHTAFFISTVSYLGGYKFDASKSIPRGMKAYEKKTIEKVEDALDVPEMKAMECRQVVVAGNTVRFGNGISLVFTEDGVATVTYPNQTSPAISNLQIPEVRIAKAQRIIAGKPGSESEATDVKERERAAMKFEWQFRGLTQLGRMVTARYEDKSGATLQRHFRASDLKLDGRSYSVLESRIELDNSPVIVSSLASNYTLALPAKLGRRMDAYQEPRGYAELKYDSGKRVDTHQVGFFTSGQPFGYTTTEHGIFVEYVGSAQGVSIHYVKDNGVFSGRAAFGVGRKKTHADTVWFYQAYSDEPEHDINSYIALWQYCRKILRRSVGLREYPNVPFASHNDTCTKVQIDNSMRMAKALGFRQYYAPACPSSIESLASMTRLAQAQQARDFGIGYGTWSPCDYSHGTSENVYKRHPEYYSLDEHGKISLYFNNFPVLNMRNKRVIKWYQDIAQQIIDAGLSMIYLDMGGTAWGNVSFETEECDPGMVGVLANIRFYNRQGVQVGVEGMNPLVLDMYWYRHSKYAPFDGKEFALVGSHPSANIDSEFILEPFRMFMYDACGNFYTDAYFARFDRLLDESRNLERVSRILPGFYGAIDNTGMPFIRQTPYGTSWISETGGAFFFWDNVGSFNAKLPAGYEVDAMYDANGVKHSTSLTHFDNIESQTIITFKRK